MASFMEVLQTSRRSQNFSTIAYWQFISSNISLGNTYPCDTATKEINDGTPLMMGYYIYEGLYVSVYIYFVTHYQKW